MFYHICCSFEWNYLTTFEKVYFKLLIVFNIVFYIDLISSNCRIFLLGIIQDISSYDSHNCMVYFKGNTEHFLH